MSGTPHEPPAEVTDARVAARAWLLFSVLIPLQIVATFCALALPPWQLVGAAIGVGDCQLLLGLLISQLPHVSVGKQVAGVISLVLSGATLHYVAIVELGFPFVGGENYLIALMLCAALGLPLVLHHGVNVVFGELQRGRWFAVSISDLLIWLVAVGFVIVVVGRAFERTDQDGTLDPWQVLEFGSGEYLLSGSRWFSMFVALGGYSLCFFGSVRLMLSQRRLTFVRMLLATGVILALGLVELGLASWEVYLDRSSPWLPVGCWFPQLLASDWCEAIVDEHGKPIYDRWIVPALLTVFTRAMMLMVSLLLIRGAGFRLVRNREWPWMYP